MPYICKVQSSNLTLEAVNPDSLSVLFFITTGKGQDLTSD